MKMICFVDNGAHRFKLEEIPPKPAQERTEFMVRLRSGRALPCAELLLTYW
jgi:hypothetical protein